MRVPVPTVSRLGHGRHPSARTALLLADLAGLVAAVILTGRSLVAGLVLIGTSITAAAVGDLYRSRVDLSHFLYLTPLAVRIGSASMVVEVLFRPESTVTRSLAVSLATVAPVVALRALAVAVIRMARVRGVVAYPTLLIGTADQTTRLKDYLVRYPSAGLYPVGSWDPTLPALQAVIGAEVDADDGLLLRQSVAESATWHAARVAIVSSASCGDVQLLRVIRTLQACDIQTFVTIPMADLFGAESDRRIDHLWDMPLLRLPRTANARLARLAKRSLDAVVSGTALLVLAPVMALIALVVGISTGRPVLFHQTRIGLGGRPIDVIKFRTVTWKGPETGAWDASTAASAEIDAVGRFLRSTSLDELPQLWLVFRGRMSLVGPRPERPEYARLYAEQFPHYGDRHRVPAGLTGLSQVLGLRGDTSIEARARFDNRYIDWWSFGLDIRVLIRTVPAVLRRSGR